MIKLVTQVILVPSIVAGILAVLFIRFLAGYYAAPPLDLIGSVGIVVGSGMLGLFLSAIALVSHVAWLFDYQKDGDKNPYRRDCKRCGQQQIQYSTGRSSNAYSWWEDVMPEPDPNCRCHKHTEYHG